MGLGLCFLEGVGRGRGGRFTYYEVEELFRLRAEVRGIVVYIEFYRFWRRVGY